MNVTVSKVQGNYAQGGASDPAQAGGAMWLAVKVKRNVEARVGRERNDFV